MTAALVLTALLAAPAAAQREWSPRRPERGRASTPYLEAAVDVAGWHSTVERQMSSGSA
jgi:hypothetical protein